MYYDRCLHPDLLAHLLPTGALRWLIDPAHTLHPLAHIEFRKDRADNKLGAIYVYLGRTAVLTIKAKASGRFELGGDAFYQALTPGLFVTQHSAAELTQARELLAIHVQSAIIALTDPRRAAFIEKEAIVHAGFMHRHGRSHRPGDPLVAIDTEVVLGFSSTPAREDFQAKLRKAVAIPASEALPKKLDTIGITDTGAVALVEIKDKAGDLARAVTQAAVHAYRFHRLLELRSSDLLEVLDGHRQQKMQIGLLPASASVPAIRSAFLPVIAAPDDRRNWATIWRTQTASVRAANAEHLAGLEFWRLSESGEILERASA